MEQLRELPAARTVIVRLMLAFGVDHEHAVHERQRSEDVHELMSIKGTQVISKLLMRKHLSLCSPLLHACTANTVTSTAI